MNKNKIREKMMYISDEIERLRDEAMTEENFWGMFAADPDE